MPLIQVITNRANDELKDGIEGRIAKCVAETLNKPLGRIIVTVVPGARVYRMESTEPACSITIHAIGAFDTEKNAKYSDPIKQCIMEELNLDKERMILIFFDVEAYQIG